MVKQTPDEKIDHAATPASALRSSILARAGWLAYVLLIIYASLYPFTGWQDIGLPLRSYLFAGMPRYWTGFDVATNILAYIPLGVLTTYALYPRIRRNPALCIALLFGIALSGAMEASQTLLPNRVASNLDLLTNSLGALIGAVIGSRSDHLMIERSRLRHLRHRWFEPQASRGLIVFALWPLAQIYPQSYLFGNGQFLPILSEWVSGWMTMPVDLSEWLHNGIILTVKQYWLTEAVVTACALAAALLMLSCMLRQRASRSFLLPGFLLAALIVKTLATALLFTPENAFTWLTPGAQGGILFGLAIVGGGVFLSPPMQRRLAVLLLLIVLAVVNIVPANPYFVATLETWVQGRFLNFNGAAQFLALLWPFFALWFLLHASHRVKQS
jgi:VanZ family protein